MYELTFMNFRELFDYLEEDRGPLMAVVKAKYEMRIWDEGGWIHMVTMKRDDPK